MQIHEGNLLKAYDYDSVNRQQGLEALEIDWEQYHQLHGAGAAWVEVKIPVVPNCPYRMVYLFAYNDVASVATYCYGEFKAMFNNRVMAKIPFTMTGTSGTIGTTPILPTGSYFHPAFQSGAFAPMADSITFSRLGQTGYIQIAGFKLVVTADTLIWTPLQQVATGGNACTFFACKSMRDMN